MMPTISNPAIPKGSTVLISGGNGFLATHIADKFLESGYKVRATVRDPAKESALVDLFTRLYGEGSFELVAVPQIEIEGAFDEAVKGVSLFVHTAANLSFNPDAKQVIPISVSGTLNALKAAYAEPSVKRFVLTSSSVAALGGLHDGTTVTEETWNEVAVQGAWAEPPYKPHQAMLVYEASKTLSEQAVWKFHKENRGRRPDFVVNCVLPNMIFGRSIDPAVLGYRSSSGLVKSLWEGERTAFHDAVRRQYYVDVEDTARLHLAAGVLPHVQDQRIFAFAGRFSWDKILGIMRDLDPNRKLPDNFSGGEDLTEIEPRAKAEELLRELGHPGWTSLADSVAANIKGEGPVYGVKIGS